MGAALHLVGKVLQGTRKRAGGQSIKWYVEERLPDNDNSTPGQFSVGYRARDEAGQVAFIKATDLEILTGDEHSIIDRMQFALSAHTFERKILEHCQGNNMDRVVTALDYGNLRMDVDGQIDVLMFLVFELAQGDIRSQVKSQTKANLIWTLSAMHHLSVAIQQLHGGNVCHNDIKPANFLTFDDMLQKLADLGSATSANIAAHNDERHDVGDPSYAAPEILYAPDQSAKDELCKMKARRMSDLYQLGSIAWFLFSGRMTTPSIIERMAQPHRPSDGWTRPYSDVIPYWREAQSRAVEEVLDPALTASFNPQQASLKSRIREAVLQLIECQPARRGHPGSRIGSQDPANLERYIALFELGRRELLVRS